MDNKTEKMNSTDEQLLETIADLHGIPEGSFNIRKNGQLLARNSDTDIEIVSKKDKDGIDIIVRPGVKNKSVHIPVLLTVGNFHETVYNDFYIGAGGGSHHHRRVRHPQFHLRRCGARRHPHLLCIQKRQSALCGAPLRLRRRHGQKGLRPRH